MEAKKYELIALSEYAETSLDSDDFDTLELMIGSTVTRSNDVSEIDGSFLYLMPDGETAHKDFLILKEITS